MRSVIAVITLVACVHAGIWAIAGNKTAAPNFEGAQLASVSYTPWDPLTPHDDTAANLKQIRGDMKALAPAAAAEQGLKVTVGAWLWDRKVYKDANELNERQLQSAIDLARRNSNV